MSDESGGDAGGQGAVLGGRTVLQDPHHLREDMKLIGAAIRNRWAIPPELRKKIVDEMALIIECSDNDALKLKAAKVVLDADRVDVARERNDIEESTPRGPQNITQINYNALSVEELEQLYGLMQKAKAATASIADDAGSDNSDNREPAAATASVGAIAAPQH